MTPLPTIATLPPSPMAPPLRRGPKRTAAAGRAASLRTRSARGPLQRPTDHRHRPALPETGQQRERIQRLPEGERPEDDGDEIAPGLAPRPQPQAPEVQRPRNAEHGDAQGERRGDSPREQPG